MSHVDYDDANIYNVVSKHSYMNFLEVKASQLAGCYHCKRTFTTDIIEEDKHCMASTPHGTQEPTVFCPLCGIDAVIGDASGYPVTTKPFLDYMYYHGFTTSG